MSTILPLGNNIMFRFLDFTGGHKGYFTDKPTAAGIILVRSAITQKVHRWGEVIAVGPKVDGIVPGDYVLVEALMWMEGTKVDDVPMWKTDDSKILAVTNDIEACQNQG
jgi:co-chaperonin GroES (HSP10)